MSANAIGFKPAIDNARQVTTNVPTTIRPTAAAVTAAHAAASLGHDAAPQLRAAGKALTTVSLVPATGIKANWNKLDTAEKALVCIWGAVATVAVVGMTIAGARQPAGLAAKTAFAGAAHGLGIGAAASAGTAVVMDLGFTQGAITGGLAKLTGLKR